MLWNLFIYVEKIYFIFQVQIRSLYLLFLFENMETFKEYWSKSY